MREVALEYVINIISDLWNKERKRGREGRGKKQFKEEVVSMVSAAFGTTVNTRQGLMRALRAFGVRGAELPHIPDGLEESAFIAFLRENTDLLIEEALKRIWGDEE